MGTRMVEAPDAKSWRRIVVASILLTPVVLALFIFATSAENMLTPIGIFSCGAMAYAVVIITFRKWRPKILG